MDTRRTTPEQKLMEHAQNRTKAWHDAAERADIRNEPALAIYFRNQAWRIENGREWLDDIKLAEQRA